MLKRVQIATAEERWGHETYALPQHTRAQRERERRSQLREAESRCTKKKAVSIRIKKKKKSIQMRVRRENALFVVAVHAYTYMYVYYVLFAFCKLVGLPTYAICLLCFNRDSLSLSFSTPIRSSSQLPAVAEPRPFDFSQATRTGAHVAFVFFFL